jgi:hypothetical protein
MENQLGLLKIALRVLAVTNARQEPNAADVDELRRSFPTLTDLSANNLACEVIRAVPPIAKASTAGSPLHPAR